MKLDWAKCLSGSVDVKSNVVVVEWEHHHYLITVTSIFSHDTQYLLNYLPLLPISLSLPLCANPFLIPY